MLIKRDIEMIIVNSFLFFRQLRSSAITPLAP